MQRFIGRYRQDLLVLLLFAVLTAAVSWPLLLEFDTLLIGRDNDVYINPWADWWTAKALTDPDLSLWRTDYLFYPGGVDLSYHSFSHFNTLISLALRPVVGVIPAFNLAILFNYALSGLAMFQLARYLTGSPSAAVFAAIAFAFNTHNLYQSSHPVLASVWCLPWLTLYLMRAVRENSVRQALVAAVVVGLGAFASTLLLVLMGIWLVPLLLYLFLAGRRSAVGGQRSALRILAVFGLAAFLLALPSLYPLLRDFLLNQDSSFVIDPRESLVSDIVSPIVPHWYFWLFRGMYYGILGFFFIILARHQGRPTIFWYLVLIGGYLFSIGPRPLLWGRVIDVTLPWTLPIAPVLRNMYRMHILESLGLAMLIAYGWMTLARSLKRPHLQAVVGVIAAGLLFLDYGGAWMPTTRPAVSDFYTEFLDDVPDDVVIATLPTGRQQDKFYMYYQTLHGHKMVGGVVSRPSDEVFQFIHSHPLLRAGAINLEPVPIPADAPDHLQSLADVGVGYLIFDKSFMRARAEATWRRAMLPLEPVYEDNLLFVYSTGLVGAGPAGD